VTTADDGKTIRVRVFARTIDGVGESADSVQTSVVAP
jgi:hypothetical protein